MRKLILAAAILASFPAYAGKTNLTWVNPATRTDGSPVTVANNRVYRAEGDCATAGNFELLKTLPAVTGYLDENVPAGTYCYGVTALDAAGLESDFAKVVANVPANPPGPVTGLQAVATIAYDVKWDNRTQRYALGREVGRVVLGTPCNPQFRIGDYYAVSPLDVSLWRKPRNGELVVKCSDA